MNMTKRTIQAAAAIPGLLLLLSAFPAGAQSAEPGETLWDDTMMVAAADDSGADEPRQWADEGAETCLECHDDPEVMGITHRAHAQMGDSRTPFAARQCEACHGASPQHLEKPAEGEKRKPPTVVFGKDSPTPVDEQNAVCLDCHESSERMHWRGSSHQFAGLSCATCHKPHQSRSPMESGEGQQDTCFDCHTEIRAQINKRSHHPIRENILSCSDCHNPHGSFTRANLSGTTVNQTCYECHEEKRGPFLWEHQPVREDCTTCHTPHGSTQPNLLETRGPWLCQRCHSAQFHPSTLYDGNTVQELDDHVIANNCLNCHTKVHGSNHPSGVRFLR
ncbi:MAG TPA: DmsE family decaheme c-type cytochrome [Arenicellales bacterium]|nr:DmsE family decaheme c-type cytochrome [Arenicellales bacterium]